MKRPTEEFLFPSSSNYLPSSVVAIFDRGAIPQPTVYLSGQAELHDRLTSKPTRAPPPPRPLPILVYEFCFFSVAFVCVHRRFVSHHRVPKTWYGWTHSQDNQGLVDLLIEIRSRASSTCSPMSVSLLRSLKYAWGRMLRFLRTDLNTRLYHSVLAGMFVGPSTYRRSRGKRSPINGRTVFRLCTYVFTPCNVARLL